MDLSCYNLKDIFQLKANSSLFLLETFCVTIQVGIKILYIVFRGRLQRSLNHACNFYHYQHIFITGSNNRLLLTMGALLEKF